MIGVVILKYAEPGWFEQTMDSVFSLEHDINVVVVDRADGGLGPMSANLNEGMDDLLGFEEYIWFLTNVTFGEDCLPGLLEVMEEDDSCAAVHPAHMSDHLFLRPKDGGIHEVPYVEWTAPFIRREAWDKVGPLDEDMGYWGFDLDWSHRAKVRGWSCKVNRDVSIEHSYYRGPKHPITEQRYRLRSACYKATCEVLRQKWGTGWKKKLWPRPARTTSEMTLEDIFREYRR